MMMMMMMMSSGLTTHWFIRVICIKMVYYPDEIGWKLEWKTRPPLWHLLTNVGVTKYGIWKSLPLLFVLECIPFFATLIKLTFTTLWLNSADAKLVVFFLFFSENRLWHFMQTDSAWNVKVNFLGKIRKNISKCHPLKLLPSMLSSQVQWVESEQPIWSSLYLVGWS